MPGGELEEVQLLLGHVSGEPPDVAGAADRRSEIP
jgi:hypothetical protein